VLADLLTWAVCKCLETYRSPSQDQKPRPSETPAICLGLRHILAKVSRGFDEKRYCEAKCYQENTGQNS